MPFKINKNLVFIGSLQFINSSLGLVVKNLLDNDLMHLSQEFSGNLSRLVKQKGMYPFEYMDNFKKFFGDELPDRCKFFSSLKGECISKKGYLHGIDVWNMLTRKTMGDYHDLNLKTDALLLADVFEQFTDMCSKYYGLDPCHYFSSPG